MICLRLFVAVIIVLATSVVALSQEVRIVKKALENGQKYDEWVVSYSRSRAPGTFELDSVRSTEAQAAERVKLLKQWNSKIEISSLRLAVILVEVNGYGAGVGSGNSDDFAEVMRNNIKRILSDKPGDSLKEYTGAVKKSYERASTAKSKIIAEIDADIEKLKKANKAIEEYMEIRNEAVAATKSNFESYPELQRVSNAELKSPVQISVSEQTLSEAETDNTFGNWNDRPSEMKLPFDKEIVGKLGGTEMKIQLKENGTAEVEVSGRKQEGSWSLDSENLLIGSKELFLIGSASSTKFSGKAYSVSKRLWEDEKNWVAEVKEEKKVGLGLWQVRSSNRTWKVWRKEFLADGRVLFYRDEERAPDGDGIWVKEGDIVEITNTREFKMRYRVEGNKMTPIEFRFKEDKVWKKEQDPLDDTNVYVKVK